jgi:hypothetical protein
MALTNGNGSKMDPRKRATVKFLEILADDFEANGQDAVERAREKDPIGYLRAIAALLPKDVTVEKPLDGLSDDELSTIIAAIRDLRAALETGIERQAGNRLTRRGARTKKAEKPAERPRPSRIVRSGDAGRSARGAGEGTGETREPEPTRALSALP